FGPAVVAKLRGTVQADILKEVQAQNEIIFPLDASLRFLGDMAEFTTSHMPRWYPISISGYHIAEAGATPVQQAAYTLSNGFAYVDYFKGRGMDLNTFGPRLSFFLDCGLDLEYLALARAMRMEESGLVKWMMNAIAGSPGMRAVERALEAAILEEFRAIEQVGGVLAATELRYQRSQIRAAAHRYERQINELARPII